MQLIRLGSPLSLFLICCAACSGSQLVFIRSVGTSVADQRQLEIASEFYGLKLRALTSPGDNAIALAIIKQKDTVAVAIDSHALELISQRALLHSLSRRSGTQLPLLILGLTAQDAPATLNRWSRGAVEGIGRLSENTGVEYVVSRVAGVTNELSDVLLPYRGEAPYFLTLKDGAPVQQVLAIRTSRGDLPTFIEADLDRELLFFACAATFQMPDDRDMRGPDVVNAFSAVAPAMLFVKYAAGDHGWHLPGHYANLTVDDPWLREPYGHLNYANLLAEMKVHNYHTTIAFIPWNYNRNNSGLISMFHENLDRYSIAVHGDNHDHKEFTDFRSSPLTVQAPKLDQALARMNAFQRLTGIPFDRVFVFPHSIGEGPILLELKRDNYLATVNSTNVPMGSIRPADPLFDLRTVTTAFYDFPSIVRYEAITPEPQSLIAVNGFLGNPLIFYTHQPFFANGIGAFDKIADEVNRIEPETKWSSLGYIVEHLFLIRQRDDSDFDVFSSSSSIDLENSSNNPATYQVTKQEATSLPIQSVTVNGHAIFFATEGGLVRFSIIVPPRSTAHATVIYRNITNLETVSIADHSTRVYLLRMASDFRDIWLSDFNLGEAITAWYYKHNETPLRAMAIAGVFAAIVAGALWSLLIVARHRKVVRNIGDS